MVAPMLPASGAQWLATWLGRDPVDVVVSERALDGVQMRERTRGACDAASGGRVDVRPVVAGSTHRRRTAGHRLSLDRLVIRELVDPCLLAGRRRVGTAIYLGVGERSATRFPVIATGHLHSPLSHDNEDQARRSNRETTMILPWLRGRR
jgi:hypothetical protein